jgi:hypothetical protein
MAKNRAADTAADNLAAEDPNPKYSYQTLGNISPDYILINDKHK